MTRKVKRFLKRRLRTRMQKILAISLCLAILSDAFFPTAAMALTGGPSQPEVQGFAPIGTSDMVDLYSGDFNYNIPLMDVDGYPLNISYSSGITMDQEASWVGLGWSLNPGVINRNMRGVPDDFNGDVITKESNMKDNLTVGLNFGKGRELVGYPFLHQNIGIGVRFNNYTGFSVERSASLSINSGKDGKGPLTGSLGLTSSSDDGLTINPSISYSASLTKKDNANGTKLGLHVGTSFNSRQGLKALTISSNLSSKIDGVMTQMGRDLSSTFNFGMPTYTPQVSMPMTSYNITGTFKLGNEKWPLSKTYNMGGYFSKQSLAQTTISNPAYGYLHADDGVKYDNALLDFNREKDGAFTESTPALPLTNFSYDIYSVMGQGIGGSYRALRGDLGYVYDATATTTSNSFSLGGEVSLGNIAHVGVDFSVTNVNTVTGRWSSGNQAKDKWNFKSKVANTLYEDACFREANEKSVESDPAFYNTIGQNNAARINLNHYSDFNTVAEPALSSGASMSSANEYRKKRAKRNQNISVLSRGDLNIFGLDDPASQNLYSAAPDHHIGEITTTASDGRRYVFGIAAYIKNQEEATFAVGASLSAGTGGYARNPADNSIQYNTGDNTVSGNHKGNDNYVNIIKTPAYAHSYLLTAVLSPDYVDADNIRGPSAGDLGNYTKFNYTKVDDYRWRVPLGTRKATFNEGLRSSLEDDKASYVYGEKELWYVASIETKNYIAVFTTEARKDAFGVTDKDGTLSSTNGSRLLRKISLYTKPDYIANGSSAMPIKEVHFEYDYSLCGGVPNNNGATETVYGTNINAAHGKLTLKKIFFTYRDSKKARFSPYEFTYSSENPNYDIRAYDKWGYYKPEGTIMSNADFPYVVQNKTNADTYYKAWTLETITLPSGGKIKVCLESDDYAYVQDKAATDMFIVDQSGDLPSSTVPTYTASTNDLLATSGAENRTFFFPLSTVEGSSTLITDINKYVSNGELIYFRFLVNITPDNTKQDYVSGYARVSACGVAGDGQHGYITLNPEKLKETGSAPYSSSIWSPVMKAAMQFARINTPKLAFDNSGIGEPTGLGESFLQAILNSGFVNNITEAIEGPNKAMFLNNTCISFATKKSFFRLRNPRHIKYGGGSRVKKIEMSDEWGTMLGKTSSDPNFSVYQNSYGQEYHYRLPDGTSAGVAAYEPAIGGDENPWKQPVFFDEKKLLVPDDEHYMEEPFGESFFPSPQVGYSRVEVKNLQRTGVTRHATGSVVHEFYTARDFPTIVSRTTIDAKRDKTDPYSLSSILNQSSRDHMTASQGYVIELNDMSGKPKFQMVYQEGQVTPITSVEYKYKHTNGVNNTFKLDNKVSVIYDDGTVANENIGVFYDYVADYRESYSSVEGSSIQANVDFFVTPFSVILPMIIPSASSDETQFRSAVVTKVINRFGILEETIAKDLGSVVSTKNLAYAAETGEVLLTETKNDFDDPLYNMSYPAYWHYDGMGPAYKNIGFEANNLVVNSSGYTSLAGADSYFSEGDELAVRSSGGVKSKAWVAQVTNAGATIIMRDGSNLPAGTYPSIRVTRSGRKNQQETAMATLTTMTNPLTSLTSGTYEKVLQAGAIEFTNNWKTCCDCFTTGADAVNYTTNPFVLGTKGFWKPKRSFVHLSDRGQSSYNSNTNIRKDGMFISYTPFYKLSNGKWVIDGQNWTFTSEVTEFSPFGNELENRDALGRYSAAQFGFNQNNAVAVTSNSRYRDMGFDSFEDYDFSKCADNHFKFDKNAITLTTDNAHSGRTSIKVSNGSPVTMSKQLAVCTESNECNLTVTLIHTIDPDLLDGISISGGSGVYTTVYDITYGSQNLVWYGTTGTQMSFYGGSSPGPDFIGSLTITDSNGCSVTKIIKRLSGTVTLI